MRNLVEPQGISRGAYVPTAWAAIVLLFVADYATGVEFRIFPLYLIPLSWISWQGGRRSALASAFICAISWVASNYYAGLRFSLGAIWAANFLMQTLSFVIVGVLIAELRRVLEREREVSRRDDLTGLLNSRAFYEETERILAISRRHGRPLAIGYIDLDNFKAVNDQLGHHAGDELLRRASELLERCVRSGDVLGRLGGDEFAILLPETGPDGTRALLERLRHRLAGMLGEGPVQVTASVGALACITPPEDMEQLIRRADSLMYAAKSEGRNRVRLEIVGGEPVETAAEAGTARGPEAR